MTPWWLWSSSHTVELRRQKTIYFNSPRVGTWQLFHRLLLSVTLQHRYFPLDNSFKSTDSPGRGACGVRASAGPRRAACWVPGSTPGPGWGAWGRRLVDVSPTSEFLSVAIGKISLGLGLTPATARRQTSPDKVTFKKEAKHSGRFQLTLSLSPGGPQGEQDADQQQHVGAPGAAPTGAGPRCARFQIRCTSSCETRI